MKPIVLDSEIHIDVLGRHALLAASLLLLTACSSLPGKQTAVVDNYNMAYATQGQGSPVVVFESGFGAMMENWSDVYPQIAAITKVFAYNRRGYEGSIPHDEAEDDSSITGIARTVGEVTLDIVAPSVSTVVGIADAASTISDNKGEEVVQVRTATQTVEELRALLSGAGFAPPYLLVGHSSDGLYALYFAKTHPDEVAGIVLVDSSHPEQMQRCRERYGDEECEVPWLARSVMKLLPDEMLAEFNSLEESGRQVTASGPLPAIPLTVLSHGKSAGTGSAPIDELWPEFQQELAAQLPDSKHIIAKNSGHFIQKDQPELVIEAIREMVHDIRADNAPQF